MTPVARAAPLALAVVASLAALADEPAARARRQPAATGSAGKGWIEGRVMDPAGWRKPVVAAVVGAGVAAVVVVTGKDGAPPATTSSTTTSTTAPTTTTTTTLPTPCGYEMSPASAPPSFPIAGGDGSCEVRTTANCAWSARSSADWVRISAGSNGRGDGTVRVEAAPNNGPPREARIVLAEDPSASCRIAQDGLTRVAMAWTSDLRVPGGRGLVILDEAARPQPEGVAAWATPLRQGRHRVDAVLMAAQGQPGTWRFVLAAAEPGSLRVIAGRVLSLSPGGVVFRLAGVAGERCGFTFEAASTR